MLKLMKSKKKKKGDSPWGNRNSPQSGIRSPPYHVLGDYIITPPKQMVLTNAWQTSNSSINNSLHTTPSPYKDFNGNSSSDIMVTGGLNSHQIEEQTRKGQVQSVQVHKDKVDSQDRLDALAKVYAKCITGKLQIKLQVVRLSRSIIINSSRKGNLTL